MDDFQLYKLQGKLIDFSCKDEILSRRDKVQGQFAMYWLMVHLDHTNPDAKTRRWEMMVTFSLLLEDGEIHPSITLDLLKDPNSLLMVLMSLDGSCHPDVGSLTSGHDQIFATDNGWTIDVGG